VRLEPAYPEVGRPYLRADSKLQVLSQLEIEPGPEDPAPGSNRLRWWTRSQRIRTEGETPFELALLETSPPPLYQQVAPRAAVLKSLGIRTSRIASELGVDEKTVRRALGWVCHPP